MKESWSLWLSFLLVITGCFSTSGSLDRSGEDGSGIDRSKPLCNVTGLCLPCTDEQKRDELTCRSSGYRQAISCIEYVTTERDDDSDATAKDDVAERDAANAATPVARRGAAETAVASMASTGVGRDLSLEPQQSGAATGRNSKTAMVAKRLRKEEVAGSTSRKQMGAAGLRQLLEGAVDPRQDGKEVRKFEAFQSCVPEEGETLSVLGFEGLVLATLCVFAPVVYHRKKKSSATLGMTRIPSSARF
eukprot:jgi/Mesen1/5917/ME000030S05176